MATINASESSVFYATDNVTLNVDIQYVDVNLQLPPIALDGEAFLVYILDSTALATSTVNYIQHVDNIAVAEDSFQVALSMSVTDVAVGTDTAVFTSITSVTELGYVYSTLGTASITASLTSSFNARNEMSGHLQLLFHETATGADVVTYIRNEEITEVGIATNVVSASSVSELSIEETAIASGGESFLALSESAVATGIVTSTAVFKTTQRENAVSVASFTDLVSAAWTVGSLSSTSSALARDAATSHGSRTSATLVSSAEASSVIWAKDYSALAWVMNPETAGIYSYNNFGFTSIAEHNGVLYASSPEGIFKISGDDDDGRKIDAEWTTGFDDFGKESRKRISSLYVSHTGGDLECTTEVYDLNTDNVYTYIIEERAADAPSNNRIRVGKGMSSRYWRLTFRNVNGADFQVHDVSVDLGLSSRRL